MTNIHFSSTTVEWYTPNSVYLPLHEEFSFTLDPCCTAQSAKCPLFFTREDNGLIQDWGGNTVFINPPYGREIKQWVEKAYSSSLQGATCVMLIPARTDTSYWHDTIFKFAEIRFMRGRIKFERPDGTTGDSAPFPTAIIVFRPVAMELQ